MPSARRGAGKASWRVTAASNFKSTTNLEFPQLDAYRVTQLEAERLQDQKRMDALKVAKLDPLSGDNNASRS